MLYDLMAEATWGALDNGKCIPLTEATFGVLFCPPIEKPTFTAGGKLTDEEIRELLGIDKKRERNRNVALLLLS